ncbi:hypothetical protein ABS71_09775 [bacterium SCN 62-11]|nr:response regulator [Candidatus Eremiobacteraeota bacterium]ODT68430.1 MAG: hypothetical protein ABS71_09775 [bacterium SCN 62-11]
MRILLVEDDETALEVFREALTEYEYEVVTARNGEDALQKARQQSFDLVVTDIRMPGTDGLQALEEVKALNPDTKSIVVTGYASEAETLKAMQIGVGEYLKKPFRLSELLQAVKRQLERTKVDERERARERALRATLMWALKMFLGESRLTRASWVQESGKWAITLGRQLGLPEEEVESLSLATILFALNKTAPDALPAFVSSSLPDSVKALLELGVEANVNPEARQVMEAAQRLAQSSVAPEQAREASDDYASRRGMLHVALSLEAAGDWENASVALAELSQSGVNREAVLASLGAGRVAWKSGKAEQARDLARQAYTLARSVGPMAQAEVVVEAGILLALVKAEEARGWLAEGKKICDGLGMSTRVSLAALAESLFFEAVPLGASLREAHLALTPRDLVEQGYWLLPALVHSQAARGAQEIYPLLTALVSSSPGRAQRFLRDPKVQPLVKELCQRNSDAEFLKAMGYQESGSEPAAELATLPTGHSLRLFGLGKMEFFVDGRPLAEPAWKRNQKAKLLLFRLALDPQRSYTDEVLIEELWPGQEHANKANLNALRATLRSALRGGEAGDGFEYIVREGKGTRIHPECKVVLDARDLQDAVQRARQSKGEPFERLHLTKVVELYTGPFLEACYLEWAVSTRSGLEQSVLESLNRLCQLAEESQNHDQVLECSTRILQLDRCNQEAYRLGMQAYLASGRPEQAVRLFERGQRVLKTELEMEPSIELLSLYHRAKLSI